MQLNEQNNITDSYEDIVELSKKVKVNKEAQGNRFLRLEQTSLIKDYVNTGKTVEEKIYSSFGSFDAVTLTSTHVSPYLTNTLPFAKPAILPVSITSFLPANSVS